MVPFLITIQLQKYLRPVSTNLSNSCNSCLQVCRIYWLLRPCNIADTFTSSFYAVKSKGKRYVRNLHYMKYQRNKTLNCFKLLYIPGQGRLDGAFCDFTEKDKMDYLKKIHKTGVKNIEMESLSFAALTHHAGIKSAVVCVTIVDRLKGDQVGTFVTFLLFSSF